MYNAQFADGGPYRFTPFEHERLQRARLALILHQPPHVIDEMDEIDRLDVLNLHNELERARAESAKRRR